MPGTTLKGENAMKSTKLALLAAALAACPVAAQASTVEPGVTVYGTEGNEVGKIASIDNGIATLDTGKHRVPLGLEAFGQGATGPTITVTKAQLDAMMDEQVAAAAAKRDAALIEGAALVSADAKPVGTIKSIDSAADVIVVERDGGLVSLKREHFAFDGNGALMALFTLEQIAAATVSY